MTSTSVVCELPVQLGEQGDHVGAVRGVEVTGRLVGEQDLRPVRERARHRDTLLLAPGELGGVVVAAIREPDALEQLERPAARLLAAQLERHLDVLPRRERRDQVEGLEHEADLLGAHAGALVLRERREVLAVQHHAASRRPVEAGQQAEQRALAAAGGTGDREEAPGSSSNVISLRTVISRPPET